jgi:hypothetical protein
VSRAIQRTESRSCSVPASGRVLGAGVSRETELAHLVLRHRRVPSEELRFREVTSACRSTACSRPLPRRGLDSVLPLARYRSHLNGASTRSSNCASRDSATIGAEQRDGASGETDRSALCFAQPRSVPPAEQLAPSR